MGIENHEIGSLKLGSYIIMDGSPCRITKMDKSKTGKHGSSKYRVEAVGLINDRKHVQIIIGHAKVEVPIVEKRAAQVLSVSGDRAQVMDLETFETFDADIDDEVKGKVEAGGKVLCWDIMSTKVIKQLR